MADIDNINTRIRQDIDFLKKSSTTKSTLSAQELSQAIIYTINELKKTPNDPTLKEWLTMIAQREMDNANIRAQLDTLKDFVDPNTGNRIIPAPVVESGKHQTSNNLPSSEATNKDIQPNPEAASKGLKDLQKKLETLGSTPPTVESLSKMLNTLDNEKIPENRAMIMNIIWSQLASAKFTMSIQKGKVTLENVENQTVATALEFALNNHLAAGKYQLAEMRSAIMTGTGRFGSYIETQSADIKVASLDGYVSFLTKTLNIKLVRDEKRDIKTIQDSKTATLEEKAFLISYVSGGYAGHNIVPDIERSISLKKQDIELKQSSVFAATNAAINTASNGALQAEAEKLKKQGGQGMTIESFMENPISAIQQYPWTSLALIAASVFKFGFFKTIGGVVFAMIGVKAVNELGEQNAEIQQLKTDIFGGAPPTTPGNNAPANTVAPTLPNIPARTPSQEKGYQAMKSAESQINASIEGAKKRNPKLIATFDRYEEFMRTPDFQNQKLSSLMFTSDPKHSVFTPTQSLADLKIAVPPDLDNATLKLAIRAYMGIGLDASGTPNTADWGKKEKDAFMAKAQIDDTWKDKTVGELTTKLYT